MRYGSFACAGIPVVLATIVFALLLHPVTAGAQEDGFKELKRTKEGITISRKAGRTKGFYVVRFDHTMPVAPARLVDKLWEGFFTHHPPVQERRFLKREASDIVFYDKVKTPVVSDRDYTMRIRRVNSGDVLRLEFQTTTEFGPPPDPAYVRMPYVKGFWQVTPGPDGGSVVRYEVYSEPGGSIPAFVIREPQVEEALKDFRRAMDDAKK